MAQRYKFSVESKSFPLDLSGEPIKRLANELGATRIIVFGDNRNDLSMMRIADHSVAVANAYDEVKAQADEVIGCNDDDAVVKWIEDNC